MKCQYCIKMSKLHEQQAEEIALLKAQLIQANLDIIRLEKRNENTD